MGRRRGEGVKGEKREERRKRGKGGKLWAFASCDSDRYVEGSRRNGGGWFWDELYYLFEGLYVKVALGRGLGSIGDFVASLSVYAVHRRVLFGTCFFSETEFWSVFRRVATCDTYFLLSFVKHNTTHMVTYTPIYLRIPNLYEHLRDSKYAG